MLLNIGLTVGGFIVGVVTMFFVYRNNIRNIQEGEKDLQKKIASLEYLLDKIKS